MLRNKLLAFLVFVIIIGTVFFVGGVTVRNSLIAMQQRCEKQWAHIETQLQRRDELIPQLIEITREYATHEEDVFTEVAESRARLLETSNPEDAAVAEESFAGSMRRLFAVVESYPELKANETYVRLQDELAGSENRIATERGRYNDLVSEYNTAIKQFPGSLFAEKLGLKEIEYFKKSSRRDVDNRADENGEEVDKDAQTDQE
ncbi:MAG: LemA family protein [Thermoguttaceae bacterium]|nr:LemA family protein [Thermoguttaceae bacterium]